MKQKLLSILTLFFFAVVISGCDCCECEVTYDFGITGIENKVETYKKGTELILERNEVVNDRLTLRGWAESKNGQPQYSITVDDDITLYAVWKKSYKVTYATAYCSDYPNAFDANKILGFSNYKEESFYTYCKNIDDIGVQGYTCLGWTVDLGGELTTDTLRIYLDQDTTIWTVYQKNYFSVEFNLNGGQGTVPQAIFVNRGDYVNYTALPNNSGFSYGVYTFEGWSETKNGKVITSDFKPEKDVVLYAVWSHNGQVKDKTDDN